MGNAIAGWKGNRTAKVMKIDGTTFKFRPPASVRHALDGHPGYVLMDSEDVKRLGVEATPLHPDQPLKPKKLYFLVELPKLPPPMTNDVRRVKSGVIMTARDRLETLKLSRRAISDMSASTATKNRAVTVLEEGRGEDGGKTSRVTMRLPRSEVTRLVRESGGDSALAAAKIVELCVAADGGSVNGGSEEGGEKAEGKELANASGPLKREKRMRFAPVLEAEIIG